MDAALASLEGKAAAQTADAREKADQILANLRAIRGEIRDRSTEGQHSTEGQQRRIAGLNLLTAIIIYWNTWKLGEIVSRMANAGEPVDPHLLPHVSLLGWSTSFSRANTDGRP